MFIDPAKILKKTSSKNSKTWFDKACSIGEKIVSRLGYGGLPTDYNFGSEPLNRRTVDYGYNRPIRRSIDDYDVRLNEALECAEYANIKQLNWKYAQGNISKKELSILIYRMLISSQVVKRHALYSIKVNALGARLTLEELVELILIHEKFVYTCEVSLIDLQGKDLLRYLAGKMDEIDKIEKEFSVYKRLTGGVNRKLLKKRSISLEEDCARFLKYYLPLET